MNTPEKRNAAYCNNALDFITCQQDSIVGHDVNVKLGIDNWGGSFKVRFTLFKDGEDEEIKTKKLLQKHFELKCKILLIAVAPRVSETYKKL